MAFDHRIQVVQDFTDETGKITEAMKKLKPGSSNHAVNDAVMAGIRMLHRIGSRPPASAAADRRKARQRQRDRVREVLTEAEFANVAIYSLDISSVVAALTAKAMPPPPPSIPTAAQHMPAGGSATPTTIEQNYYNGNYIPVFVDIFKAVKSVFVDDTLDVFTRFTGGKEYSFVSERSLEKAIARHQPGTAQPISVELHAEQSDGRRIPRDSGDGESPESGSQNAAGLLGGIASGPSKPNATLPYGRGSVTHNARHSCQTPQTVRERWPLPKTDRRESSPRSVRRYSTADNAAAFRALAERSSGNV